MSDAVQFVCTTCGKSLSIAEAYTKSQKTYCAACYRALGAKTRAPQEQRQRPEMADSQKKKLYGIVCDIFKTTEVPENIVTQIDRIIKEDPHKSYWSLWYTLNYVVNIAGLHYDPDPVFGIKRIVEDYYKQASAYYLKTYKIAESNKKVDLEKQEVVVRVTVPKPENFKAKTRIEDL